MDARGTEMQRDAVSRRHEPNPSGLRATKVTKEGVDAILLLHSLHVHIAFLTLFTVACMAQEIARRIRRVFVVTNGP